MKRVRLVSMMGPLVVLASVSAAYGQAVPPAKPSIAKICTNCHKAEPGMLRGYLDNVTFKSKALSVKMDDAIEILNFDEDTIQVVDDKKTTGDGELLRDNNIKKGHEIRVAFTEKNGVKTAVKLVAKPPVELPKEMLFSTADVEKLVKLGPEKGKYFLFDSRPAPRFQEGAIPTAVNLPFPAFDKMAEKLLPPDKEALIIFYCSGVTCNMSPGSATKAQKLGYRNIKVYKDGMPAWSEKHYGVLPVQALKEAWIDKDLSYVLLDARPASAAREFIKGAVSFPAAEAKKLVKSMGLKQKKAPVVVYDAASGKDAAAVAEELLKAGYGNVKVLTGGFEGWKAAQFPVETGRAATKVVYVPKLKPGEMAVDEFKKTVAAPPADTLIIDVRGPEETKVSMIKTAKAFPLSDMRDRLAELPKDKNIVLYCNTGTQSEMAYSLLKEAGYSSVKYLNAKLKFEKDGSYSITKD